MMQAICESTTFLGSPPDEPNHGMTAVPRLAGGGAGDSHPTRDCQHHHDGFPSVRVEATLGLGEASGFGVQ